jgi:membrane protease YdiL (CAAX protease family)
LGNAAAVLFTTLLGTVLTGVLCIPTVRMAVARRLPIDPKSHVHAIGLALTAGISVLFFGQLAASAGHPVMLDAMKVMPMEDLTPERMLFLMVFTLAWTVPAAIVAVGFPLTRNLKESLARLGFVRPTGKQVLGGLVGAGVLVAFMAFAVDPALTAVWKFFGWPPTDVKAFEELLAPAMTPLGAVVIAITAGVGEEMGVRGVLQPRLGILLPNLFFTSLHAMQYGFDGLLSVFIVGMILGVIRLRTNTTTSAIVHGTYDFILVMLSISMK